jgi:hypothetical protein
MPGCKRFFFLLLLSSHLIASEHKGLVLFGGLPVPGASVTAERGGSKLTALCDSQGRYTFQDLSDGEWKLTVAMQMFAPMQLAVAVAPGAPPLEWKLDLQPAPEVKAAVNPVAFQKAEVAATAKPKPAANTPAPDPAAVAELAQRAADGLLINGSVNNGAASPFAQLPAFGNNRRGQRSLYNGSLGLIVNNALFDARPFSITGQDTPKPGYGRLEGLFSFGGPIRIPGWIRRNGPILSLNYQWTRSTRATTQSGLVPTEAERNGEIAGNRIAASQISPQAKVLMSLYPLPNFAGNSRFNFQAPVVNGLHQDDLQTRLNKQVKKNFYTGSLAWRSTRTDTPDLLGFLETGKVQGWNSTLGYRRTFNPRAFMNLGLQWSRLATDVVPFFANRRNVSAEAGISGNNQDPMNWGPPSLSFTSGLAPLFLAQASQARNQTAGISADGFMNRGSHNLQFGYTLRRQQFNELSQQDARGSFAFTGSNDFAKFLTGTPDTSTIAFGNADKYLRGTIHEAFANDDWRINPGLTVNYGVRWEYWSPLTEKYGRLVNLEVGPGFSSARPQVSGNPLRPDRNNVSPRIGVSWRPLPASSMVVRAGYGIYYDTSVYQALTMRMAQQAPLSTSLRLSNSALTPLTLANGFNAAGAGVGLATTFGVDPGFRIGYSQNWMVSLQRDLPWALQLTATYSGSRAMRGQQQILPNTFPDRAAEPSGFSYLTSNGIGNRHAGQLQVRRRLRSGLAASVNYTYAKAMDNSALGGQGQGARLTAQNWLNLDAEWARSNFDQRHLLVAQMQYTSGMGLRGGALSRGWIASALKEWTLSGQLNAGTGLPLTPIIPFAVVGTGVTGTLRPDSTGADVYDAPQGLSLNPLAFRAPAPGQWGNAGRNSITGPAQFSLNGGLSRPFRSSDRVSYEVRIEATNLLNTVTYPSWNTVIGNLQFGLPNTANPMRNLQATVRMRF